MSKPSNADVANALYEIADLLEIKGGDRFRFLAYRRAADAIESHAAPVAELKEVQLVAINGVGKGMAARVKEFADTGRMQALDDLRAQVPIGLRQMTLLPGVGPKRAMQLYQELGVSNLEELKQAAEAGRITDVKGFGKRFEEEVLGALERGVQAEQRLLIARALPAAQELLRQLNECDAVIASAYAGSLRRMRETIGDIDLLASSERPDEVMDAFRSIRGVVGSKADGPTKSSIVTASGLQVDLRVVEPVAFGAALQYFTGSREHNVRLRQLAIHRGLKLSEYGVFDEATGARVAGATEEDVYAALGLPWIPPELREDSGELEAAREGRLPRLVEPRDLRGDLHDHTDWSDGHHPLEKLVAAAEARGYEYIIVSDHSRSLTIAGGLSVEELRAQRVKITELQARHRIRILAGSECDILEDGRLDFPDEALAELDVVLGAVHSRFKQSRAEMTARIVRALGHPHLDILAHPTGRKIGSREPYDVDMEAVFAAAKAHGKAIEINASPERLDMSDVHARRAAELGIPVPISTDTHYLSELDWTELGCAVARRAWIGPEQVLNTRSLADLLAWTRRG